jgi:hypothetical protein
LDRKIANMAAIVIQAAFRGFIVRKRLQNAKHKIRSQLDDDEFNLYEEIDLKQFDFDEAKYEIKLPPAPKNQQQKSILIKKKQPEPVNNNTLSSFTHYNTVLPSLQPSHFAHVARNPIENIDIMSSPTPTLSSRGSVTNRVSKHEHILNEWGFKDERTAMLMLQRAEKMKYKAERRNKIKSLDPKQRLKLLRKFEKINPTVASEIRTVSETFRSLSQAQPQAQVQAQPQFQESNQKVIQTYEWLYSQVREFAPSPAEQSNNVSTSQPPSKAETKVPKLPILKLPVNSPSISRYTELKPPTESAKFAYQLPPLNGHNQFVKPIIDLEFSETNSIASSRSSFTQLYVNKKPNRNRKIDSKKRRMT